MSNFTILLPPAEGKRPGGNPFAPDMFDYRASNTFNYFNELNPDRRILISALQKAIEEGHDLESLFQLKGGNLEEAVAINRDVLNSPLMATLDRYSPGVMYQAMDFTGLPTGAQRRLLEHTIIFSGLFGLLRPDDLIPNYRLRMDATLPEIGKVSRYWRPHLSEVLNQTIEDRFVWNLLPAIHQEAWEDAHTYRGMAEVRFFKEQNGTSKAITHGIKTLRGALVNFIVREGAEDPQMLAQWVHPDGYRFDPDASTFDDQTKSGVLVMVARENASA